jgi:hypothetical protein
VSAEWGRRCSGDRQSNLVIARSGPPDRWINRPKWQKVAYLPTCFRGVSTSLDGRLLAGVTVFSAAIEYGSFARSGEALGISASGVSHAIAPLEMRMEVRLIERTTPAMSLTGEGAAFTTAYDRRSKRSRTPPPMRRSPRSGSAAG